MKVIKYEVSSMRTFRNVYKTFADMLEDLLIGDLVFTQSFKLSFVLKFKKCIITFDYDGHLSWEYEIFAFVQKQRVTDKFTFDDDWLEVPIKILETLKELKLIGGAEG